LINGQSASLNSNATLNCEDELIITESVFSGETDDKSAKNIIFASNIIDNQGTANYDAGEALYLKTGFHVKPGATFSAFIKGCENTNLSILDNNIDNINIYPNPTSGVLYITISNKIIANYSILNLLNKTIIESKNTSNKNTLNLQHLSKGLYFIKIVLKDGQILIKKIIKS
jgi:hypothetical protein